MASRTNLHRLLAPHRLVVMGGAAAEVAIRQCRSIGYAGEIWPVHPRRTTLGGEPCFADLDSLPGVPDAAFVSVSREQTVPVVAELAARGTGGVVCHASGFAEDGPYGAALQRELVAAAHEMALIGPNCLGVINYLDGAALWCEQHGGARVDTGVAVIAQSGNLAINVSMQRRSLPLAALLAVGNCAVTSVPELVEALLDDQRVTAIGLYLEDLPDVAELSRAALRALRRAVPLVVLKAGSSELGARTTLGHTSAIATQDVVCDALFRRLGIARVHTLETFVECLKLLHVHGALPGDRITSASCSGGEAAYVADLAHQRGLTLPPLGDGTEQALQAVLGDRVHVSNPLDYHTYIWGDSSALTACFTALLGADADAHLLLLDYPRADRCDVTSWDVTVDAFRRAGQRTGARTCVVSSLPEGLPESVGAELIAAGIAPMQGVSDCLAAVAAGAQIGAAQAAVDQIAVPRPPAPLATPEVELLDEAAAKEVLATLGVVTPERAVVEAYEAATAASGLGFPVVVKAVSAGLAHKSELGAVRTGLRSAPEVDAAVADLAHLTDRFLVEVMVEGAVAELLVGVRRDPHVGLTLTIGAGGVLVELLQDTVTLLLPATTDDVRAALRSLRIWPLLAGYRGRRPDVDALVGAVDAIAGYACRHADRLVELEVNPLLVMSDGVVAVDALIRRAAIEPAGVEAVPPLREPARS